MQRAYACMISQGVLVVHHGLLGLLATCKQRYLYSTLQVPLVDLIKVPLIVNKVSIGIQSRVRMLKFKLLCKIVFKHIMYCTYCASKDGELVYSNIQDSV